jgi:TolB-like protein/DNA-binding winged helix-turn-helix (wHTH) protein/Tfp pilus assembly protein PilF
MDVQERTLERDGVPISLTPKAFDILRTLAERPGRLLTKQELIEKVWPDAVVEEANLARNIFTLRKLLGEDENGLRYIETIPKVGYRFVASVQSGDALPPASTALESPSAVTPSLRPESIPTVPRLQRSAVLAVLALAAITGLIFWWQRPRIHSPSGKIMLAVLPFENLTGDPGQDYFSDGFTEEMITELGELHPQSLAVIARTSAMQYRGTTKSVEEIGRELGVQYVLEGSVRRGADRVRISAQLIQASDQTHLWAESYDRDARDVLQVQSEVARAIAGQIDLKLTPEQRARPAREHPVNPEAYNSYLQGRYFWNRRSPAGYQKAIEYFDQAIARDPGEPRFHAGLADAYALLGSLPDPPIPRAEAMEHARSSALKALSMDDSLAEAHTSLAFVLMHYDWDWPGAEREYSRALELNPGYATAHHWYAYYLAAMDQRDKSLGEVRHAQELDPLSLIIMRDVGEMLYFAGQYDDTISQCQQTLERNPSFSLAHSLLGLAYMQKHMFPEMSREFRAAEETTETPSWVLSYAGAGYAIQGNGPRARKVVAQLRLLESQGSDVTYSLATIYAAMGEKDAAFEWLDRAYKKRIGSMILLRVDPLLDPLRGDPRFASLLRRMKFPV